MDINHRLRPPKNAATNSSIVNFFPVVNSSTIRVRNGSPFWCKNPGTRITRQVSLIDGSDPMVEINTFCHREKSSTGILPTTASDQYTCILLLDDSTTMVAGRILTASATLSLAVSTSSKSTNNAVICWTLAFTLSPLG